MASTKKRIRVVAALIKVGDKYLITQRRPTAVLPLLWEFPGGRVEDGEDDTTALKREMMIRLSADVEVVELFAYKLHAYDHYDVDFYLYDCRLMNPKIEARAVNAFRWVTAPEFDQYQFTPVDESSMSKLLGEE